MIIDSVRKTVWDYVSCEYPTLINIAAEIAMGNDPLKAGGSPLSACYDQNCPNGECGVCGSDRCPKPINYLAHGDRDALLIPSPFFKQDIEGVKSKPPTGFVWRSSVRRLFTGCNFDVLDQLADAKANPNLLPTKTCGQLRGFNTGGKKGLSIMFSPWTDFCLWSWARFPAHGETKPLMGELGDEWSRARFPASGETERPILILGKDTDIFAAQAISAAHDWGEDQVEDVKKIWSASDRSTQNLFGTLANYTMKQPLGRIGSKPASSNELDALQRFIATERIFIYNVWPWFRCGVGSSGNPGIHSDFSKVPYLWHELDRLIDYLKPRKIAALGCWSWDTTLSAPDAWLRNLRKRSTRLSGFPAGDIDVFRHPSAPKRAWFKPWQNPPRRWVPGGLGPRWGGEANNQAFVDFCFPKCSKSDLLEMGDLDS